MRHPRSSITYDCVRWVFLALIACCSFGIAAYAQRQPQISANFSAISLSGGIGGLYYDSGASGRREMFIPNGSPSLPQRYMGAGELSFYELGVAEDGSDLKRIVASVDLSAYAGKDVLLLFTRKVGGEGYDLFAVNQGVEDFPARSWRIFNFTGQRAALRAGEGTPVLIDPGRGIVSAPSGDASGGEIVQIGVQGDRGWNRVYDSIWSRKPQVRTLVLLLPGESGHGIRVSQIHLSAHRIAHNRGLGD